MSGLILPSSRAGNPLAVDVDPELLFTGRPGQVRCELVDASVRIVNPPRCVKLARWIGFTRCVNKHLSNEKLCDEHQYAATQGQAWWKCDVCGQPQYSTTSWSRL